jgi:hypothetical protein
LPSPSLFFGSFKKGQRTLPLSRPCPNHHGQPNNEKQTGMPYLLLEAFIQKAQAAYEK